ncbi:MAG: hypothetical protein IJI67_04290 [Clostridia bacterium]|nr:hypothetical protein [Clostridia bacterium]
MTKKNVDKILTMIAFVLLWVTQGMFYYLEIASSNNVVVYTVLCILCVSVFSLTLFGAKYTAVFAVNLAGLIGLILIYLVIYGKEELIYFAPLVCFAPLLFLNNSYLAKADETKKSAVEQVGYDLFCILPLMMLVLIIFGLFREYVYFEKGQIYFIFIGILVASLYFFSAKRKKDFNGSAKGKRKIVQSRFSFMMAGILIIESCLYCVIYRLLVLSSSVMLLWTLVYVFLYKFENPVCVNVLEKIKNRFKIFLNSE